MGRSCGWGGVGDGVVSRGRKRRERWKGVSDEGVASDGCATPTRAQQYPNSTRRAGTWTCARAYAYVGHIHHFYHEIISADHAAHILERVRTNDLRLSPGWPHVRRGGVRAGVSRNPALDSSLLGGREGHNDSG